MPFHGTEALDPLIETWLRQCGDVERALDVGAGAGWRGRQMRAAWPGAEVVAYETEIDYVQQYGLKSIYDGIRTRDVMMLLDSDGTEHYDAVFLGDVIEHLKRSDGLDLLHYLVYRTRHLFVVYPERYVQDAWEGHNSEAHRSAWELSDFKLYDPLWTARAEPDSTHNASPGVLVHGFGYLATAEDKQRFARRFAAVGVNPGLRSRINGNNGGA